jgi:hypothetical protein
MTVITNKTKSPMGVWASGVRVEIPAGQSRNDLKFTDQELAAVKENTAVWSLGDTKAEKSELQAIADLFGTPDIDALNVKAAVERLIQDYRELKSKTEKKPETGDLAAAVALLDDKNDDHWTQAGKPKLASIAKIYGKDVSASDYDALPETAKRERKTD